MSSLYLDCNGNKLTNEEYVKNINSTEDLGTIYMLNPYGFNFVVVYAWHFSPLSKERDRNYSWEFCYFDDIPKHIQLAYLIYKDR